ncbi:MAG: FAD-dependent oxidoreductase [Desulfobacteraceae bacterium]
MEFNLNLNFQGTQKEHKAVPARESEIYDSAVIGGGPAAVTAAVYLMRKGIRTVLITKGFGGQVADTKEIENYLGFSYIEGSELVTRFTDQVKQFEIAVAEDTEVESLSLFSGIKQAVLSDGRKISARTIIICAGSTWKKLGVKGEDQFRGRGVAYCSTCDAPFFRDRNVFVIGGGNSGAEAALDLLKVAEKITIVEIEKNLKADKVLTDKIRQYKNYEILTLNRVAEIKGNEKVESVVLENSETGEKKEYKTDGVFVEIGMTPNSSFIGPGLDLNQYGEIIVDSACRTNIPGVFAAGDITSVPFKQIVIAAGEGAKAALSASDFLMKTD